MTVALVARVIAERLRNPKASLASIVECINYHILRNEEARFFHWRARGRDAPPRSLDKYAPPFAPQAP